jgi:hypothetical protein
MNPLDEFFGAHRNGHKKSRKPDIPNQNREDSLNLDTPVFHWSATISFSLRDVFKAGLICGDLCARMPSEEIEAGTPSRKRRR